MDAKKRAWLSKNEALSLGIIPKENEKNRNNVFYERPKRRFLTRKDKDIIIIT